MPRFMGIDAGTGSARSGDFDETGRLLGTGKSDVEVYRDDADFVEQSSSQIWAAVGDALRTAFAAPVLPCAKLTASVLPRFI